MCLIENYEGLLRNQQSPEVARNDNEERVHYAELIRMGKVFLPYIFGSQISFGPSRFLGYGQNTVPKHLAREGRDGKVTNVIIRKTLHDYFGVRIQNVADNVFNVFNDLFLEFCDDLGVEPVANKRTFWITPDVDKWVDDHRSQPGIIEDSDVLNQTALPETTRRAIIRARVGQGFFRRRVLAAYGKCLLTDLEEHPLLIASHIKPWKDCFDKPDECLDPHNALLLSPTWDKLFDAGYISFSDDGELLYAHKLSQTSQDALGLKEVTVPLSEGQRHYMEDHRRLHGF